MSPSQKKPSKHIAAFGYQTNREQRSFVFVIFWQKRLASHLGPCWSHTIAADATDLRMYWMAVWVTHAVVG